MSDDIRRLRGRIAELAISHQHVARSLGVHPSVLSRILRGKRAAPAGFVERANAVLDIAARDETEAIDGGGSIT